MSEPAWVSRIQEEERVANRLERIKLLGGLTAAVIGTLIVLGLWTIGAFSRL